VLPVVKTVEAQMSGDPTLNHEYLPLDGLKSFLDLSTKMVLGDSSLAITQDRVGPAGRGRDGGVDLSAVSYSWK